MYVRYLYTCCVLCGEERRTKKSAYRLTVKSPSKATREPSPDHSAVVGRASTFIISTCTSTATIYIMGIIQIRTVQKYVQVRILVRRRNLYRRARPSLTVYMYIYTYDGINFRKNEKNKRTKIIKNPKQITRQLFY